MPKICQVIGRIFGGCEEEIEHNAAPENVQAKPLTQQEINEAIARAFAKVNKDSKAEKIGLHRQNIIQEEVIITKKNKEEAQQEQQAFKMQAEQKKLEEAQKIAAEKQLQEELKAKIEAEKAREASEKYQEFLRNERFEKYHDLYEREQQKYEQQDLLNTLGEDVNINYDL